jgi:hypothetical protein
MPDADACRIIILSRVHEPLVMKVIACPHAG